MRKLPGLIPVASLLFGMAVFGLSDSAQAGFKITIDVSGTSQEFVWDGASTELGTTNPQITVNQIINGVAFNFRTTVTNSPGGPTIAFLDQAGGAIDNQSGAIRAITMTATSTGYSAPLTPPELVFATSQSGTVTMGTFSNVMFDAYVDQANAEYATSGSTVISSETIGPLTAGTAGSLDGDGRKIITSLVPVVDFFSMTSVLSGTLAAGTRVTGVEATASLTPVPEPTTLAAAFTALPLLGFGYYIRRRSRA